MSISQLVKDHFHLFKSAEGTVLDLACGEGQNGLLLTTSKIDILFSDINTICLDNLQNKFNISKNCCWYADFESASQLDAHKLGEMNLQGAIIIKYLHRPLFDKLKQSIKPNGYIIYETFTENNRQFGRPNRDDFLLKEGELKSIFKEWEILFYFEGIKLNPKRAIAQIVCRKTQK